MCNNFPKSRCSECENICEEDEIFDYRINRNGDVEVCDGTIISYQKVKEKLEEF